MASEAQKIANNMFKAVGVIKRKTALSIYTNVVAVTPVDTGRARASWRLNAIKPDLGFEEKIKGKAYPYPETPDAKAGDGDAIFISNNLPYIVRLNEGHSKKQAPKFVERAIARALKGVGE